jgi:GNAT superfamily N-acetyltransferase
VAEGLTEFLPRLQNSRNRLWLATTPNHGGQIVGSIAIDCEDLGAGQAHLRWFILDDGCRGQGLGSALLHRAIEFVEQEQFTRTVLWTFKGLDAARHLYERHGFRLVDEYSGAQWGLNLMEQRFVREGVAARSSE